MTRPIDADALDAKAQKLWERNEITNGEWLLIRQLLSEQPTIDAEPVRHGKWLWLDGVRCSECNYKLETTGLPSYCPNCGADMRGEE